jgi:hypothetical protein
MHSSPVRRRVAGKREHVRAYIWGGVLSVTLVGAFLTTGRGPRLRTPGAPPEGVMGAETVYHPLFTDSTDEVASASEALVFTLGGLDKCAGQWREGELVGPCFGLDKARELEGGEGVLGAEACRDLCCTRGEECVTWQWNHREGCLVGGPVRVGLERAGTGNWCEETAPSPWR